jgi:hypothetical protein
MFTVGLCYCPTGMGDLAGLVEKISDVVNKNDQKDMIQRIQQGQFSLRDMYEQFENILQMGPLNQVMEMVPGMSQILSASNLKGMDSGAKLKIYMNIMDSMTNDGMSCRPNNHKAISLTIIHCQLLELDDDTLLTTPKRGRDTRIIRIARGSGRYVIVTQTHTHTHMHTAQNSPWY